MKAVKEASLQEPLIDMADAQAVISDSATILNLNLMTCIEADLTFTSHFRIQVRPLRLIILSRYALNKLWEWNFCHFRTPFLDCFALRF